MPRRKKQSDLEILIEFLLDIGGFIGKAIFFIFKGIFSLLNSNKRGFAVDWDEEVRKNQSSN